MLDFECFTQLFHMMHVNEIISFFFREKDFSI